MQLLPRESLEVFFFTFFILGEHTSAFQDVWWMRGKAMATGVGVYSRAKLQQDPKQSSLIVIKAPTRPPSLPAAQSRVTYPEGRAKGCTDLTGSLSAVPST